MKKSILLCSLVAGLFVSGSLVSTEVSATEMNSVQTTALKDQDKELPRMTLYEALTSGVQEAIITEIDIPVAAEFLESLPMMIPRSSGGKWVYMYTAEPYALYRHSKTKEWKMVQVTPTWQHVQNTVVNGWISSMAGSYNYANSFGARKP
ncbi:hypothetical protein [Streptococcus canis]|uniref:hypothetical protein n=1 Tax=Streptococcus canis TaxID=1329 RepID=UPI002F969C15